MTIIRYQKIALTLGLLTMLGGCAPEVGSERWCNNMKDKPAGDWTANEGIDYAKHCVLD